VFVVQDDCMRADQPHMCYIVNISIAVVCMQVADLTCRSQMDLLVYASGSADSAQAERHHQPVCAAWSDLQLLGTALWSYWSLSGGAVAYSMTM